MTVYIAQATGSDPAALLKARIVRDGFSWAAFLFGPFWLLWHRVWIALLVWIVGELAFVIFITPHVPPGASLAVDWVAHLYLALEGNRLRLRRKAAVTEIIEAHDREEAEALFFRRQLGEAAPAGP